MDRYLRLTHAYGFNQDDVIACCLAEHHGLACAAGYATQRALGRRGADVGVGLRSQSGHARFVTQYAALGALAGWIDGEDADAVPLIDTMLPERVNECAFANAWDARYADSIRAPRVR